MSTFIFEFLKYLKKSNKLYLLPFFIIVLLIGFLLFLTEGTVAFCLYFILMIIIGISAFYHDSACALIRNGRIICAIQKRGYKKKNGNSFPINALIECLNYSNVMSKDIDYIVFYEKPFF